MFPKSLFLILSLLLVVFTVSGVKAAGDVDTSFKATAYANDDTILSRIAVQPDGKILVSGNFTVANGIPVVSIVRLNTDGNIDPQFNAPPFFDHLNTSIGGPITEIGIQSDGKIVVAGQFTLGNLANRNITRLNTDGSLDNTFADLSANFGSASIGYIYDLTINPDDSIYIAGQFTLSSSFGTTRNIAKLESNGTINFNSVFNASSYNSIAVQNDGRIVAGGGGIVRFMPNGNVDNSFPSNNIQGDISKIIALPDGKILIGGGFTTINGFSQGRISRLNADGSIDTTFNPGGIGADTGISDIVLGTDGKILITGNFTSFNNSAKKYAAKLNADGTLDNSFTLDSSISSLNTLFSPVIQNDGKILIGLNFYNNVYRLNNSGSVDISFRKTTAGRGGVVFDIIQQPDGKILAAGFITFANDVPRPSIVRYNLDGTVDTTFSQTTSSFTQFMKLGVQADGKIVIVDGRSDGKVIRLNADGSNDGSFNQDLFANGDVEILADGKLLIGARRVTASGGPDNTYSIPSLNNPVYANKALADGKYLIGGEFTQVNGLLRGRIARLNNDGTLDTTFNPLLGANGAIYDLDVQPDGKIIIAGIFTGLNGVNRSYIGRLNTDGSLDTSFAPVVNSTIRSLKVQTDGKILIGGFFTQVNGVQRNRYARLNTDGSLDTSLIVSDSGIASEQVFKITQQSDGNILLGGYFARIRNVPTANIARLLNNSTGRTPFDYDGDGRADVSVFRPSNGVWYLQQSQNGFTGLAFGQNGDRLVPADYDGDGKTDLAVNRNGTWYLQRSQLGFTGIAFGDGNDIPVPADYDGDGRADVAVFRPSNGVWYLQQSTAGFAAVAFGLGTDKPVPADYNGDGRAEVAVFRPSNGYWYLSTDPATGYGGVLFGTAEDKPVPADYDGDGKTDVAVFRPSNGTWYLRRSQQGFTGIAFGLGSDLPTPADYDGDGKADVAVFRNGVWYLNRSSAGFTGVAFGSADDKPIPNAFVR